MATKLSECTDYELLDFGNGRKLERFGDHRLNRPCIAADHAEPLQPKSWNDATKFVLATSGRTQRGSWQPTLADESPWTVRIGPVVAQLKLTAFGHIGLFPEHYENWQWAMETPLADAKILNLFAYTGVFSLLLASRGGAVTHVDSSSAAVRWARKNAELSNLNEAPIRWIVEDVLRFVRREIKRGTKYDGFIVDAPSYGRGPRNESWKIERDLGPLLDLLSELASDRMRMVIISAHTAGFESDCLTKCVRRAFGPLLAGGPESAEVLQRDKAGRELPNGFYARWKECIRK